MDQLAERFSALAPAGGHLSLINLTLLRALLEQGECLEFLTSLLSHDETRVFAGFTYPKRTVEWLGGRITAKHSLCRLATAGAIACLTYRDYSLLPDEHGRPCLAAPSDLEPAPAISISHSHGYAVALTSTTGTCGIDIQLKSARLATVQERFTSEKELALLRTIADPLTRLGILWTAKEAIKKSLLYNQATFFGTIRISDTSYQATESIWEINCSVDSPIKRTASVRIVEFGDYIIACTTGENHA
jgi:phosphopantetheinyl transferase